MVVEGEGYALQSSEGAIAIAVNVERLNVSKEAISRPDRVMGQIWPGEEAGMPSNVRYIFKRSVLKQVLSDQSGSSRRSSWRYRKRFPPC